MVAQFRRRRYGSTAFISVYDTRFSDCEQGITAVAAAGAAGRLLHRSADVWRPHEVVLAGRALDRGASAAATMLLAGPSYGGRPRVGQKPPVSRRAASRATTLRGDMMAAPRARPGKIGFTKKRPRGPGAAPHDDELMPVPMGDGRLEV